MTAREVHPLAQAMWDGLRILGFDIEDATPAATLVSGEQAFIEYFLRCMHEERRDHDAAIDEVIA